MDKKQEKEINASKEFIERMELIKAQKEVDRVKHLFKMEELRFERESSNIIHEQILERGRISRAENKKLFMAKQQHYKYENKD